MKSQKRTLAGKAPAGPCRVCVVARDLVHSAKGDDEIGAINGLTQALAAAGNDVTLLWVPWRAEISAEELADRKRHQTYHHMITVDMLARSERLLPILWSIESQSLALYHYLQDNNFDVVVVQLEGGLAYYSLLAIETGVFADPPAIVIAAHAPLAWMSQADRFFLGGIREVSSAFMEKYCAEEADVVVCSSDALVKWMASEDWKPKGRVEVRAPLMPWEWQIMPAAPADRSTHPISNIVLLATPRFRDGTLLFCDVLDHLARSAPANLSVTTFGPFDRILGEHTGGMVLRRSRRWPFSVRILPNASFRERLEIASRPGTLAVIPSVDSATGDWVAACVDAGIPFVTTSVGANIQFVAEANRPARLAPPKPRDLARLIEAALAGLEPALPAVDLPTRRRAWTDLVAEVAKKRRRARRPPKTANRPLVSIIMAHFNRPQYLPQAIAAVEAQTYPNIELIVVDDGSDLPAAKDMLSRLEPSFKAKGWRIIRQKNQYLGVARNTGIKASKGEYVLFADDDNALFPEAVETFVNALESSGADICTALQMLFYEEYVPKSRKAGTIQYIPLGHSTDLGFIHDCFGDANAMLRRSVFKKIGLQNERYGFIAQDWEMFARATLAGLKLRLIPEPLYWYRSSTEGMYRTSNWYDTRQEIIAAYRKHGFRGLDHLHHIVLAQNVTHAEMEGLRENLRYSVSDAAYLKLSGLDPNSEEAIELLAFIAASEGRADTALTVLGRTRESGYVHRSTALLGLTSPAASAAADLGAGLVREKLLLGNELQQFTMPVEAADDTPFFIELPNKLFVGAHGAAASFAILTGGCPAGTSSLTARVSLDNERSSPLEVLLMASAEYLDPVAAAMQASGNPSEGSSGWMPVTHHWQPQDIAARFNMPSNGLANLILGVRVQPGKAPRDAIACWENITLRQKLGAELLVRPRIGAPPHRQRTRSLSDGELRQVRLMTDYKSERPLLLIAPDGGGIFLRPHPAGPVAAILDWHFPAFARKVIASVEIAHDEASPFEFAVALSRPDQRINWKQDVAGQAVAFSGWVRVERGFSLTDVEVDIGARIKTALSIDLAIRLPDGSIANPSNAYFRKIVLAWDE